ncbi:MAG: tRNA 2-thiouridine(34) synthase MnmA [Chloroflexi bacterium HGW-Chloroflexi-8]|nr:MAG: tRNA 2-thiouridine(34) synthase MnmA [Chloroflexi bacterium HGW-Chloroflexi-8]
MNEQKPTIVVAVSGGVDSSVVAAMLTKSGYPVIGVMMHLWSEEGKECENKCCTPQAMEDARKSAQTLGFPFYTIDAADIFRKRIVQYFLDGYAAGKTPNPCVNCNREIKWGLLLDKAKELGGDFLATGHYVRRELAENGKVIVKKARDSLKDQSYVMSMLNQSQLKHTLFPLGDYLKTEVRDMAREFKLPMAEKKDSQDLCFVSDVSYKDFLLRNAPEVAIPGVIFDKFGNKLGEHQGLAFYTIGQRKGIGIAAPEPLYVLDKDPLNNSIIVGTVLDLNQESIIAKDVNWISGEIPANVQNIQVKIRYKAGYQIASLEPLENNRVTVHFDTPVRDATPGQFAVFYDGDIVLGGGEITKSV